MASQSTHLTLDQSVFNPSSIPPKTNAFNQKLMDIMAKGPKWFEVGASKYRQMRAEGKTPLPAATYLDNATTFTIPSRDSNRTIPCRILKPTTPNTPIKGVYMHIHGGGWVLQDEKSQDPYLQHLADSSSTLAISIGYRLAPEDPFPAGPEDCYDAAEWLVQYSQSEFGAPLAFIGGESAGAHLSMLVAQHLLFHPSPKFSHDFSFKGLLLHFGVYDVRFTPNVYNFRKPEILVLDEEIMTKYREAFLPGMSEQRMRQPDVSPLYRDLEGVRGRLPAALFTCGTEDPLLDDTVFMSCKWMMAGGEAVVKIVPGGAHGYIFFVGVDDSGSKEGLEATVEFMNDKLR